MTECTVCKAAWDSSYLCDPCCDELRDMLTSLIDGGGLTRYVDYPVTAASDVWREELSSPGLLSRLEESSVGHVRLGEQGRWIRREQHGLDGDDHPIQLLPEGNPDKPNGLEAARELRPEKLRRQYLASGRCNERAVDLLNDIERTLKPWACGLAKLHNSVLNPMNPFRITVRDFAGWLAANVDLIAKDEDAGFLFNDVKDYQRRILQVVNRPIPPVFVGMCDSPVEDHSKCVDRHGKPTCSKREHICGTSLWAKRGAIESSCPTCKRTHNIEKLWAAWIAAEESKWYTIKELVEVIFPRLPPEERVPKGTIYDWLAQHPGMSKRSDDNELMVQLISLRRLKIKSLEQTA